MIIRICLFAFLLACGLIIPTASLFSADPPQDGAPPETPQGTPAPNPEPPPPVNPPAQPPNPQPDPENVQQQQPSFLVRASVDRASGSYREGDPLVVKASCEVDAYLYVIYKQSDGKVFQIFPNSGQPNNQVKARQTVQVPAFDDRFRWQIGAPFGKEVIKVIASKEPLKELSAEQMKTKRFNPLSTKQLKGIEIEIGEEPASEWAEDQIEITTYARTQEETTSKARRFGVFLGVSEYLFNNEVKTASEGKQELNLSAAHRDARRMSQLMREFGRLDDVRLYTNDQATRAQFEQAVTKWLPSVSRPGDTVVIYFSGHGGQIPDDNGDEADKLDEILLPNDFLSGTALVGLIKEEQEHKLDPRYAPIVAAAKEIIRRAPSVDKAVEVIARQTGISDDLFGHWLQRLAGRQVIVVFDICHAGGFAAKEKSLGAGDPAGFDYLDKELGRLKDLGQPETALMAACHAQQSSLEKGDLGVMTFFLAKSIEEARAALPLKQAAEQCATEMHDYFVKENARRQAAELKPLPEHQPVFYDYCTRPPLIKP